MDETSLMLLVGTSAAATAAVKLIASAVGEFWKPHQRVRMAQAEREAQRIDLEGEVERSAIATRAEIRAAYELRREQRNLEDTIGLAVPQIRPDASPEDVSEDWVANLLGHAKQVSDGDMQALWARLLAEEMNQPGSFSRRTVNLVADLGRADAEVFSELCRCLWYLRGRPDLCMLRAWVYGDDDFFMPIEYLFHLEALGLVRLAPPGSSHVLTRQTNALDAQYFAGQFSLECSGRPLDKGPVLLTPPGRELARVARPSAPFERMDEVLENWRSGGIRVLEVRSVG